MLNKEVCKSCYEANQLGWSEAQNEEWKDNSICCCAYLNTDSSEKYADSMELAYVNGK